MVTVANLLLPKKGILVPEVPSYLKLDMAFGLGEGAKLGDKSRYRSHGTISGASWAAGLHGKCLDFVSAAQDYVEIPAAATQLDFTSGDFSIIARVNIDDLSSDPTILVRGLIDTDGYWFRLDNAGRVVIETMQLGTSQLSYSAIGVVTVSSWFTVGLSRTGTNIKPYANGIDVSDTVGNHTNPATCGRAAIIGVYSDKTTRLLDGKIEFLRIFGGIALPASTHLAYHNALA